MYCSFLALLGDSLHNITHLTDNSFSYNYFMVETNTSESVRASPVSLTSPKPIVSTIFASKASLNAVKGSVVQETML